LLSTIIWQNEGGGPTQNDADHFEAVYGASAPLARAIVRQAISDWEQVLANFNYKNVGQPGWAPVANTFFLNVTAQPLAPGDLGTVLGSDNSVDNQYTTTHVVGDGTTITQYEGKPYRGTVLLDDDGGGHGWYFDPTPGDNSEFPLVDNPFSARGNLGGQEDFLTTALREIGQAVGITTLVDHAAFAVQDQRPVGQDPNNPRFLVYPKQYIDRAGNLHDVQFTQADGGGLKGGFFGLPGPGTAPIIPADLMMANQPVNTRDLISDTDVGFLWWGYPLGLDYHVNPPDKAPSETLRYPTDLGATFLTDFDLVTGIVTVRADPRVADNSIKVYDAGTNLFVELNGVVKVYPLARVRGVQIDAGPGNATVAVPSDLYRLTLNVAGGGRTVLGVADSSANAVETVAAGQVRISLPPSTSAGLGGFLPPTETINYSGLASLNVVGLGDRAIVAGTPAGTAVRVIGQATVTVGSGGSVRGVAGPVTVAGLGFGFTALTVDDSSDSKPVTATVGAGSIFGLAPGAIDYNGRDLRSLTIDGGTGGNTFTVAGTPQDAGGSLVVNLKTGAGADHVDVQATSSDLNLDAGAGQNTIAAVPSRLSGTLSTLSTGGAYTLTLDDPPSQVSRSVSMAGVEIPVGAPFRDPFGVVHTRLQAFGLIQGFGAGPVFYDPSTLDLLVVKSDDAGAGTASGPGNRLTVVGTFGPTTELFAGARDVVDVLGTTGGLGLYGSNGATFVLGGGDEQFDRLRGTVVVVGGNLIALDQRAPASQTVDFGPDYLGVNGSEPVVYDSLSSLTFYGSNFGNVYNVYNAGAGSLTVHAGTGNDVFRVANVFAELDRLGSVLLIGDGGKDVATVDDSGTRAHEVYTVTEGSVGAAGRGPSALTIARPGASVALSGMATAVFHVSNLGGTVDISNIAPGTALGILGGAGDDRFVVGRGVASNAPISIDGGGGVNTLDYSSYKAQNTVTTATTGTLPPGLVAWYKAEGNPDDAAGGHDGTATRITYGPGEVGQAFQTDGTGAVDVPDSPSLDTPQVTVEAWVKSATAGPTAEFNDRYIVAKGPVSYGLSTYADGGLVFFISNGGGSPAVTSPDAGTGIWDGKWHHVAGTYDGTTVRLYVDGQQVGNGTAGGLPIDYNLDGPQDLRIGNPPGASTTGPFGFDGSIDELSVYSRALSPAEIQAIFAAGPAGKTGQPTPSVGGVEVDLQTGTATGLAGGVTHIQNVIGSFGNDILVGDGGNSIDGLGGQDVLIAGPSASTLFGTGADILIGGTTVDDRDLSALEAVLSTWSDPTADYATRVARLRGGPLAAGNVLSNKQANTLKGGTGPNLFFATAADTTNRGPGETTFPL
jgi:hypothetical protein